MPGKAKLEIVKLQLAMAFGRGAGSMLADADAIRWLLGEGGPLLRIAVTNWDDYQAAFCEHMGRMGQIASVNAGVKGHPLIEKSDMKKAFRPAMYGCPCWQKVQRGPIAKL